MSELCGMFGELPYDVWAVREFLPTRPLFRCERYGGFPVVREFRFFVDGGEYLYHQPYWPEDALAEGGPDDPGWRDRLEELHRLDGNDLAETRSLAKSAGLALGGRWSVDIVDTERGWYITDTAPAERSWGWLPIIRPRVA